jgi:hypothetical protein
VRTLSSPTILCSETGALTYDVVGNAAGGAIQFATLLTKAGERGRQRFRGGPELAHFCSACGASIRDTLAVQHIRRRREPVVAERYVN